MVPEEVVKRALEVIGKSRSNYEYFFAHLTAADWLDPLAEQGFFRKPEPPIREGDGVRYPFRPESRYLARVAGSAPDRVLEVALAIPETDNVRVHEDLAQAAIAMPASLAAKWVEREVQWLEGQRRAFFLLPDELGRLITHLAEGGEVDAAFVLARALLEPLVPEKKPEGDETIRWPANPVLRVDPHDYSELLRLRVPELAAIRPLETLEMLSDFLEAAIRIYMREDDGGHERSTDYSYLWRPAIEEHEQNALREPYDAKGLLTLTIRDLSERLTEQDAALLPQVVDLLERRNWPVLRRIALHLLRRFAPLEEAMPLIAERLVSEEHLLAIGEQHEYGLLLRDQFVHLSNDDQQKILKSIETGFDPEAYARGSEKWSGQRLTDEDIAAARDYWQLRRLSFIADDLRDEWKERYDALVAKRGAPEQTEFPSHSVMWTGPNSPRSDEELTAMTIDELVSFLREWRPSGKIEGPSPEGLGRALAAQVRSRLEEFASQADRFIGLEATYVRSLLDGLPQAEGEKLSFEWAAVLKLARWVVEQPREIPGRSEAGVNDDVDPSWGWARKSVARLLGIGFESQTAPLPAELRALVWEILRPITDDPDPTPEHEAQYGGSNMDPLTLSINSTRGEAMHSVVRYCIWVRRQLETAPDADERLKRGFDEMPEARETLNVHLDPARDSSVAVRAIYGQWLPWLLMIDEKWTRDNVGKLFPVDPNLLSLREATWDTYVVVNNAYTNCLDLLRDQYAWAIERLGSGSRIKSHLGDPDHSVARHLMIYYWQGRLDLDDRDGLLGRFYTKAPDSVRGDAIDS